MAICCKVGVISCILLQICTLVPAHMCVDEAKKGEWGVEYSEFWVFKGGKMSPATLCVLFGRANKLFNSACLIMTQCHEKRISLEC